MKRALVISGGGSKGAFAGGVAEYLITVLQRKYDIFIGSSTGSLLIPHLALNKIDKIKSIYSTVTQKQIFNNNPFVKTTKNGITNVGINHFNLIKNFIKGSKTFGESYNLKKLIKKHFSKNEFDDLLNSKKEIITTVSNLTLNNVEYKSITENSYEDFCEWLWISCNFVPFMSLYEKQSFQYADGAMGMGVPLEEAVKRGAREIDAIVLNTEVRFKNKTYSNNPFSLLNNLFQFILDRIETQNIKTGLKEGLSKKCKITLYYTPSPLTKNSLIFDTNLAEKWWKMGYIHAKNENSK